MKLQVSKDLSMGPDGDETSALTDRRGFLRDSALAVVTGVAAMTAESRGAEAQGLSGPIPTTRRTIFVAAETTSGKVQGIDVGGIKSFKGIPYGAPTSGAGRFMPPRKPEPWSAIRECISYGGICPQIPYGFAGEVGFSEGRMGEDCLNLNVWTPAIDKAKRAVLVGLVGGGWDQGSGNGVGNDGAQLARFGDVVVVTVTHRLASQGFLHLGDLAPEFANSGVAGLMDMTLALQWVRDNISNFGGDPSRVMIFGCSGGGWKTSAMLGVPAANGLFHRAAIQSGSTLRLLGREKATERALLVLGKLGISKTNVRDIQKVSWQQLLAAQVAAVEEGAYFSAVLDGNFVPRDPFFPDAVPGIAPVQLMVGTTLEDTGGPYFHDYDLNEAGLVRLMDGQFAGKGAEIVALYRKHYPNKTPFLLEAQIMTDASNRLNATRQVELKSQQRAGSAYFYRWDWPSPPGKLGATHAADAQAALHNVTAASMGSGSPEGVLMEDRMASAWVAFAKTGDPNNPLIPRWEPYNTDTRPTMLFDSEMKLVFDPQSELRKYWPIPPEGRVLKRGSDGVPRPVTLL